MRAIAELTIVLRGCIALPDNLKLVIDEFQEGWNLVRSGDANWLDKKIRRHGWYFIRIAEGSLRSGVGTTSQEAVVSALKLALRRVSDRFNAAKVEHIELTEYPWFFLARISVYPYQIQQSATLSMSDKPASLWIPPPTEAAALAGNQVVSAV